MSIENMLSALTQAEKLAAIDFLWRDLAAKPAELLSPDWHGDVLQTRMENPSSKPRLAVDAAIDQVKERPYLHQHQTRRLGYRDRSSG